MAGERFDYLNALLRELLHVGEPMAFSREEPSAAYVRGIEACRAFHLRTPQFNGRRVVEAYNQLAAFFEWCDVKTAIDYGCGKGEQHGKMPLVLPGQSWTAPSLGAALGVQFTLYDPAVAEYATLPTEPADAVVVFDVMEYIPASDCPWVMAEVFALAKKCVFLNASTFKPSKLVDQYDRPRTWWFELLQTAAKDTAVDWMLRLKVDTDLFHLYRLGLHATPDLIQEIRIEHP